MKTFTIIGLLFVAVALYAQDSEAPDPLATEVFQRAMSETLVERAFRLHQLYGAFSDDRVVLDSEIDVINGQRRFRQAVLSTGSRRSVPAFAEIDLYGNGPVTPIRIGMGIHPSFTGRLSGSLDWSMLLRFPGAPFSTLTEVLRATGVYGPHDIYDGYFHMGFDVWAFPYTSSFAANYPEVIRAKPAIGASEDYSVPTEGWTATFDLRILDYVDTRYFRGLASWSSQTLIDIVVLLLTGEGGIGATGVRVDGGTEEYRWFGDNEFAVFNEVSAELDLAALLRTGASVVEDGTADARLPSVYALAQRVIERVANRIEQDQRATADITRYGVNLERLALPGTPDLYGYRSQLNRAGEAPQFWEAGFSWNLGPLAVRGNGVIPSQNGDHIGPPLETVYGAGAGLTLGGKSWRFAVNGDRVAGLTGEPFYEVGTELDSGRAENGFGLTAGLTVIAPDISLETREQEARLGLRFRDSSFAVLGGLVESLLLEARLEQTILEGEQTRSVLGINMTAALH